MPGPAGPVCSAAVPFHAERMRWAAAVAVEEPLELLVIPFSANGRRGESEELSRDACFVMPFCSIHAQADWNHRIYMKQSRHDHLSLALGNKSRLGERQMILTCTAVAGSWGALTHHIGRLCCRSCLYNMGAFHARHIKG